MYIYIYIYTQCLRIIYVVRDFKLTVYPLFEPDNDLVPRMLSVMFCVLLFSDYVIMFSCLVCVFSCLADLCLVV